ISDKSLDKREDIVPGRFSTTTFASPFIPEIYALSTFHIFHVEFANTIIPTDAIPKALTDRTNTPAINTAAFKKLDGNILAATSIEVAKKVGNKAASHNGKRTENGFDVSDPAPKDSAVENSSGDGEDKKNKRAIEERGIDISQTLPKSHPIHTLYGGDRGNNYNGKRAEERRFDLSEHVPEGHPKEYIFDKERKDRRGDGVDTSREPTNILIDNDALTDCLARKIKLRDCMQEFIVHEKRLVGRDAVPDHPPPQSTNPHHVAKPKPKHPSQPKPKPKPKQKPADTYECGGAVVCKLKRALRMG
ncbi:MAG: hypothetical protein Q9192_006767, partial [Flavoplaca navasiana]